MLVGRNAMTSLKRMAGRRGGEGRGGSSGSNRSSRSTRSSRSSRSSISGSSYTDSSSMSSSLTPPRGMPRGMRGGMRGRPMRPGARGPPRGWRGPGPPMRGPPPRGTLGPPPGRGGSAPVVIRVTHHYSEEAPECPSAPPQYPSACACHAPANPPDPRTIEMPLHKICMDSRQTIDIETIMEKLPSRMPTDVKERIVALLTEELTPCNQSTRAAYVSVVRSGVGNPPEIHINFHH